MKIKSLFIVISVLFITLPAYSYVITEELTTTEQMINYNYSSSIADYAQLVKAQNANREYKSGRVRPNSFWKRLWEYIDPAADDGHLLQHDIKPAHSWQDW